MKRWLKRIFAGLAIFLIVSSAGFWIYVSRHYVVPILMYHSVNPVPNPQIKSLIVSPDTFERQMRFLRQRKYNIMKLEDLAQLVREGRKIPAKTVAITFDDGYQDVYTWAFPVLKKYGIPATLFIIVHEVGRPLTADLKPGDARLTWKQITEMQDSGLVSFGSHCLDAEPLVNLKSRPEIKRQIFASKYALQARLSREVRAFSYPEGLFNDTIRRLVREAGYQVAVATSPGRKYPSDDVMLLKRIRISENARNLFVFWFESSGYYTFFKERRRK